MIIFLRALPIVLICSFYSFNSNAEEVTLNELEPLDKSVELESLPKTGDGLVVLNKHDFWVNFFRREQGGKLTFLPFFGGKTKNVSLIVQKDYVHYRGEKDNRVGVLIRIEAHIKTDASEIEIKDFHDLGAAAQLGVASGRLYVKVWGLAGAPVFKITTQANLNSVALADIEEQLDALHKKVYSDSELIVDPVLLPESIFEFSRINRS